LSGPSGGDDLLLQGAPTRYRLDLTSLIFNPVIKYYPLLKLKKLFQNPSESKLNSEDAYIFTYFVHQKINDLKELAGEIDEGYSKEL
ncbi:MAG: hypothetical protein KKD99_02070, partial [Proteobacteria bacterium]|nr:hypothetical protein [Pseudomonadota bacterium]